METFLPSFNNRVRPKIALHVCCPHNLFVCLFVRPHLSRAQYYITQRFAALLQHPVTRVGNRYQPIKLWNCLNICSLIASRSCDSHSINWMRQECRKPLLRCLQAQLQQAQRFHYFCKVAANWKCTTKQPSQHFSLNCIWFLICLCRMRYM